MLYILNIDRSKILMEILVNYNKQIYIFAVGKGRNLSVKITNLLNSITQISFFSKITNLVEYLNLILFMLHNQSTIHY